ncbi:MAG: MurR/RpiR family transcriptional regulator [Alphaproteobacteria bacterium]
MALKDDLHGKLDSLTAAERKVATALLADYPFAGLMTVVELAERSNVSSQSILRLVAKLDFHGYGDFQRALISEIKNGYKSPVTLRESVSPPLCSSPSLAEITDVTVRSIHETVATMSEAQFVTICEMIADTKRSVFLIGGRMSHTLATFLFRHLRQIRPKVYLIPEYEEEWPEYLLRMGRRDIVLMFDYRRYQKDLERLAERAVTDRGVNIVLFTDKWLSPVSKHSHHILASNVEVGTPWDTSLPLLLVIEAIINRVSEQDWNATRKRIRNWDDLRSPAVSNEKMDFDES